MPEFGARAVWIWAQGHMAIGCLTFFEVISLVFLQGAQDWFRFPLFVPWHFLSTSELVSILIIPSDLDRLIGVKVHFQ